MSEAMERLSAALSGRYEIERELGEGGMATVYLARDVRHERNVALKVLRPELSATMGPDRFLQEVRVTANLQHPHILPLFDSGEADGFLYYVMPYLEGESLRDRLARESELPVAEAVKILREVVDALAAAHQMGVVHRDIKPDNVMLSGRHAVVTDFGVAKAVSEATGRHQLTTVGVALGTPSYMAPEQAAADENIDHRADIYAVGAMGYELLAGRPPFCGMTPQRVLSAHVTEVPQDVTQHRAAVPPQLGSVIMRCLEKKPADRWQSAEELLTQLEIFATPTTGITPAQSVPTGTAPAVNPSGLPKWAITLAPIVILVGIAIAMWQGGGGPAAEADGTMADAAALEIPAFAFAVAPFVNQSGVDSLDAFGSIMADYLSGQISRNDIAPVTPAAVVRELAASRPAGTDVVSYFADETGAAHVITGTYFVQGGSLVIQAEVVPTDGSQPVSVDPVQAPLTSFMDAAQAGAEVLLGVAARIVDPDQPPATVAGQPRSFSAYRNFVDAVDALVKDVDRPRSLDLLGQAIEEDSTFAEAWVMAAVVEWQHRGLSIAVDSLVQAAARYRDGLGPWDAANLAWIEGWVRGDREGALRAAIEIDRLGSPLAYVCRDGRMANRPGLSVPGCLKNLEDPEVAALPIHFSYTWVDLLSSLHLAGDFEEELAQARRMRALFPDRRAAITREIRPLAALGRLDDVLPLLDTLRARSGEWDAGPGQRLAASYLLAYGHAELAAEVNTEAVAWYEAEDSGTEAHAIALFQAGDFTGAMGILDDLAAAAPDDVSLLGWAGAAAARAGRTERAAEMDRLLAEIEAGPFVLGIGTRFRAAIAAASGELDRAVELLRQAYEEGGGFASYLRTDAPYTNLQGYPPFERFMEPRN